MAARADRGVDVWIEMEDGVRLAATVYRPDTLEPVPCLLEALPYRKDDVTASYAGEYERLRDEFGYAVCRLDLRGTGSSEGIATDEYPVREQDDLCAVIEWLGVQDWCDGNLGMYGTSYSGFNSIQVAMRRPAALKAIVAIYATDDRYTDDVHFMGGSLRLLDVIDYPTYMIAMNALPPAPALAGAPWRDRWRERVQATEPWLIRWLEEQSRSEYWQHGSLRPDYAAITTPTMIVAGWADGYRNNTFRTYQALTDNGTPARLLVGPWGHASTASAMPGPNLDLVPEMVRWFDRWLRGRDTGIGASTDVAGEPALVYFARRSTPPSADAVEVNGRWQAETRWPTPRVTDQSWPLAGTHIHSVRPDTGLAAWNSCAGHLPYGQPQDQVFDDAASVTFDWPVDTGLELLGHAVARLRVAADQPVATVSVKLCDVGPAGESTLITRGLLNLSYRNGFGAPVPMVPGEAEEVTVEFEATAWTVDAGHRLRLAVTGVDWPNTVAPPNPVVLTIHGDQSALTLPVATGVAAPSPATLVHRPTPAAEPTEVVWRTGHDILGRVTTAEVDHGSAYPGFHGATTTDRYTGTVAVDRNDWSQRAESAASFVVDWLVDEGPIQVRAESSVRLIVTADRFDVDITVTASEGATVVGKRQWTRSIARRLA